MERVHTTLFLLSMSAIAYGCWQAWPPLGWIVPGVLVLSGVVWTRAMTPPAIAPQEPEND